jgi:DNA-binding MarR family transcriptional regulator
MIREMAPSRSENAAGEQVQVAMRKIMRAIDLHSRYLSSAFGLTGPQLAALRVLVNVGELSTGELARQTHQSQATVTGILDRLARRGLVHRCRDDADRRRVMVRATPAGAELLAASPPPLQRTFLQRFEQLDAWEKTWMLSALQRLVAMMEMPQLPQALAQDDQPEPHTQHRDRSHHQTPTDPHTDATDPSAATFQF